jgi:rubrerythrin
MELHEDLVKLVEEQIGIEKESVAMFAETEQRVGTSIAKLLLREMRMDSQKHASILEEVLETLKGHPSPNPSWQEGFARFVDPLVVKREIEKHKDLTKSMQAHLAREMSKTKDKTILALLTHLAQDERRHNEILDTIAKNCDRMIR